MIEGGLTENVVGVGEVDQVFDTNQGCDAGALGCQYFQVRCMENVLRTRYQEIE